jgi:hypothetical protein
VLDVHEEASVGVVAVHGVLGSILRVTQDELHVAFTGEGRLDQTCPRRRGADVRAQHLTDLVFGSAAL